MVPRTSTLVDLQLHLAACLPSSAKLRVNFLFSTWLQVSLQFFFFRLVIIL
jgi:hypothetical protein